MATITGSVNGSAILSQLPQVPDKATRDAIRMVNEALLALAQAIAQTGNRINAIPTLAQIRTALQASGSNPLSLMGLPGLVPSTRAIGTSAPLTGGGTLAADILLAISTMVGDSGAGGSRGVVPAPAAGDAAAGKFLKADGTWAVAATPISFISNETPTGVIDGANVTFTLAHAPTALLLFKNRLCMVNPTDYGLAGSTITYTAPATPLLGDIHVASFYLY